MAAVVVLLIWPKPLGAASMASEVTVGPSRSARAAPAPARA